MKVIEQGLRVTSRYFGDGYVVRTILDATANVRYVAIRKDADNGVLLCVFPHSVNYLFDLPLEFSQSPTNRAHSMSVDELSAPYCANHKYIRIELSWPVRVGPRSPRDSLHGKPDSITPAEMALSLDKKNFELPEYLNYLHSSPASPLMEVVRPIDWNPSLLPSASAHNFASGTSSEIHGRITSPYSHDSWDVWAKSFDPD